MKFTVWIDKRKIYRGTLRMDDDLEIVLRKGGGAELTVT